MCTSREFTCKCGKMMCWLTEGKETKPCPECGRVYLGYYDCKNLTIGGKEVKRKVTCPCGFEPITHAILKLPCPRCGREYVDGEFV